MANGHPALPEGDRTALVDALMGARCAVGVARRSGDSAKEAAAWIEVDAAKHVLGERGPWWDEGAPDFNRHLARNTPYAGQFARLR